MHDDIMNANNFLLSPANCIFLMTNDSALFFMRLNIVLWCDSVTYYVNVLFFLF